MEEILLRLGELSNNKKLITTKYNEKNNINYPDNSILVINSI
jgi:hypothetical protein